MEKKCQLDKMEIGSDIGKYCKNEKKFIKIRE